MGNIVNNGRDDIYLTCDKYITYYKSTDETPNTPQTEDNTSDIYKEQCNEEKLFALTSRKNRKLIQKQQKKMYKQQKQYKKQYKKQDKKQQNKINNESKVSNVIY